MKTNNFNYRLLELLGINLSSEAKFSRKIFYLMINCLILIYEIFFALLSSINYVIKHFDDTIEVLLVWPQVTGISACILTYIILCANKNIVNEIFHDFENIVIDREKYSNNNRFYQKTIKLTNQIVKYMIAIFLASVAFNICVGAFINVGGDLLEGEINVENWRLPYRYEYLLE